MCCSTIVLTLTTLLVIGLVCSENIAKRGRVLFMPDNQVYSRFKLAVELANALHSDGLDVDFVVADSTEWEDGKPKADLKVKPVEGVNVIRVPVVDKEFSSLFFDKNTSKIFNDWRKEVFSSRMTLLWESERLRTVNYYKAIVENPKLVNDMGILDWLRQQTYNFGIAEIDSAFAVFHELEIKNTILLSATPGLPAIYHFLGMEIPKSIPEHYSAQPGDGKTNSKIRRRGVRQRSNIVEYTKTIKKFQQIYGSDTKKFYDWAKENREKKGINMVLKDVPPLTQLINQVKYFFVNTHPLASFPRPMTNKVKLIGGIEVEKLTIYKDKIDRKVNPVKGLYAGINYSEKIHGELTTKDKIKIDEKISKAKCVVIFSLGTAVNFHGMSDDAVKNMFNAFKKYPKCQFIVRIEEDLVNKAEVKPSTNVHVVDFKQMIPQHKIFTQSNLRGIIHHCGQNTLTEALYAAVPMICIPFFADQRFNSAVMEYMGVGLWNQHSKFADTFAKQLDQLLEHGESNKYYQKIMQLAKAIHNSPAQHKTFLDAVNKIIEEDYSECTNLPLSEKVKFSNFFVKPFVLNKKA